MTSKNQTIRDENSLYSFDSLSPPNRRLLKNICKNVTPKSIGINKVTCTNELWDGRVFYGFITRMPLWERNTYIELLYKNGVNYKKTLSKISSGGMGEERSIKAFCLSAKVQKTPFEQFLVEYIQYCRKINFEPKGFIGHEETIKKLLDAKDSSISNLVNGNEQPKPSLQDVVIINNEIDAIKQNLKLYPYGKDKFKRHKSDLAKNELALLKINQLLVVSYNNLDLLSLKVTILCNLKQKHEALKLSSELLKQDDIHFEVIRVRIFALGTFKKDKEALKLAIKTQKLYPNSVAISSNIGTFLERLGKYQEAIDEFTHAISLDEDLLKPYWRIAFCYERLNQFEKCESALKSAHHIAPENIEILSKLMLILSNQGKEDEVIQYAQNFIDSKNSDVFSEYMAVAMEVSKDNIAGAEIRLNDLRKKLESELPESSENISTTYFLLSLVLQEKYEKDPKNINPMYYVKECCSDALELNPNNCGALSGMARASFLIGDVVDAKQYLDKIDELYKKSPINDIWRWVHYIQLSRFAREKCKHPDHALPLMWCSEKYGNDIACMIVIAHEYILSKDLSRAKTCIDKAAEIAESNDEYKKKSVVALQTLHELGQLHRIFEDVNPQQGLYLRRAIELFKKSTTGFVKSNDIEFWRYAMSDMGDALRALGFARKDKDAFINAICVYEELLKECPRYKCRELWIHLNNAIGDCYGNVGSANKSLNDLNAAIKYKKNMLQEITVVSDRDGWLSHILRGRLKRIPLIFSSST